jgi:SNF2 family DNA or RNA helicase
LEQQLVTPGSFLFEGVYWHRLICDEFHELAHSDATNNQAARKTFLNSLKARFYLGLTGTPQYKSVPDVVKMGEYLRVNLPYRIPACNSFLRDRVRRNEPDLQLPTLTQRLIWIQMNAQEQGLFETLRHNRMQALMACSHYHVAGEIVGFAGVDQNLTIDQVADRVQAGRLKQIENYQKLLPELQQELENARNMLKIPFYSRMRTAELSAVVSHCQEKLDEVTRDLKRVQSQYTYFQAILMKVREVEEQTCPLCLDELVEGSQIAVTACGHVHCAECMHRVLNAGMSSGSGAKCTICRAALTKEQVSVLVMTKDRPAASDTKVDRSKFGSKLNVFAGYLDQLFHSKPQSKVILFIQFRRLMSLVSNALTVMGVSHVECTGNVYKRTNAVEKFKHNMDMRLMLLSSEDSVSGLHLPEATHVVIFHPFLIGDAHRRDGRLTDEQMTRLALDYENQGIARAWRGGQTHPVEVVRLLVKNSVEEEMAARRDYKDGELVI